MLVYNWLDPRRMSYSYFPGQTGPSARRGTFSSSSHLAVGPVSGRRSTSYRPQHQKWGLSSSSACLGCSHSYTHTTFNRHALAVSGSFEDPRSRHLNTSCAWNWGPSCRLRLRANGGYAGHPGTVMGAMRGCSVLLDGDGAHPSAVVSVRGGDCMAATVFIANGPELM